MAGHCAVLLAMTLVSRAAADPTAAAGPATTPSIEPAATTSPGSEPTTAPTPEPSTQADVDPAATPLLAKLAAAYGGDRPMRIDGTLFGTFDVAGRQKSYTLRVTGRTDGHGRFLHRGEGAGLLVNDGHDAYLYDAKQNSYASLSASGARYPAADVDASVINILLDENPALLLSIVDDPAAILRRASDRPITLATGPTTAPVTQPATMPSGGGLVLSRSDKAITLLINPDTGELLGSVIDYAPLLATRKTSGVHVALAILTYDRVAHDVPAEDAFAWHPPVTATEFAVRSELLKPATTTQPATHS